MTATNPTGGPGGPGAAGAGGPPALLVLEDGTAMRGSSIAAGGTRVGEVVFNTAMAGYQEVLTDPSYHRQIVTMTAPQVGNYGVNAHDRESDRLQVAGFVVREAARTHSNHRAEAGLRDELTRAGVVAIEGVDTRALTRHIRTAGAMRGAVSTEHLDVESLMAHVTAWPGMAGAELASLVTCAEPYDGPEPPGPAAPAQRVLEVVAYDFGLKRNILRLLAEHGVRVRVVPATTPVEQVLARRPDGVFLSNGPGDPAAVEFGVTAARTVLDAGVPLFGICLGHQLLARALGARTYKLPFGHRGVNQPVRHRGRRTVEISTHNHGFAVDAATLPDHGPDAAEPTHDNLNDGVNEGLRCVHRPAFSVQYHPEAGPGTHDSRYLFADFVELMAAAEGR